MKTRNQFFYSIADDRSATGPRIGDELTAFGNHVGRATRDDGAGAQDFVTNSALFYLFIAPLSQALALLVEIVGGYAHYCAGQPQKKLCQTAGGLSD